MTTIRTRNPVLPKFVMGKTMTVIGRQMKGVYLTSHLKQMLALIRQ